MIQITSVYRKTAEGALAQAFAVDLLRGLGGDTLSVLIPYDPSTGVPGGPNSIMSGSQADPLLVSQSKRILDDVRRSTGIEKVNVSAQVAGGIVVDHHGTSLECEEVDTLYPRRETTLLARGKGAVLIPFGDSVEAVTAAERAFAIARALALPVVLYHTTWKDAKVGSDTPQDHMCAEAHDVSCRLQALAHLHGLKCKVVVETADDVVEGIIRCAMRESASLIVMTRSSKTTVGCYVDQALKQSPVPLLAIAALDRRRV